VHNAKNGKGDEKGTTNPPFLSVTSVMSVFYNARITADNKPKRNNMARIGSLELTDEIDKTDTLTF